MRTLVIFAAIFGNCMAGFCVHTNFADLTEEHVIQMVVTDADHNDDGLITDLDVAEYFILGYDRNNNHKVEETEFVNGWRNFFHDEEAFAQHIFHHIDADDNGVLDLDDIPQLKRRADTSGDNIIQIAEFEAYLKAKKVTLRKVRVGPGFSKRVVAFNRFFEESVIVFTMPADNLSQRMA